MKPPDHSPDPIFNEIGWKPAFLRLLKNVHVASVVSRPDPKHASKEMTTMDTTTRTAGPFFTAASLGGVCLSCLWTLGTINQGAHARPIAGDVEIERVWTAPGGPGDRQFGYSVAVSGRFAAIARDRSDESLMDRGSVRIIPLSNVAPGMETVLRAPDRRWPDRFGAAMDFQEDRLLVGAPMDAEHGWDSGATWYFERRRGEWTTPDRLMPSQPRPGDRFGASVAMEQDLAVVGAPRADDRGLDSGAAHAFTNKGGRWQETQIIHAPDAAAADFFGSSIAMKGDWLAIGAWADDDHGEKSGSVWLFHRKDDVWCHHQKLAPKRTRGRDRFGWQVEFAGSDLIVSACGANDNQGMVLVYGCEAGRWTIKEELRARRTGPEDWFGFSLAAHDDVLVIGSPLASVSEQWSGRVSIHRRMNGRWIDRGSIDGGVDDYTQPTQFGWTVATNGSRCVVGRIDDADGIAEPGRAWLLRLDESRLDAGSSGRFRAP